MKDKLYRIPPPDFKYVKGEKTDGYIDVAVKRSKFSQLSKLPHDDWTKPKFSVGGAFLKGPKI